MLLLDCSNSKKIAYNDMSRLTGIATSKQVKAVDTFNKIVVYSDNNMLINTRLNCILKLSEPSLDYSSFYGRLKLVGDPGGFELKLDNIMFKGCTLEGVDRAICLALYCGSESKIQMNSKKIYHKTSLLEQKVNQ